MSMRNFLLELTHGQPFCGQVLLKTGMNVMAPRRIDVEQDPEAIGKGNADVLVGMLILPGPKGQPNFVKGFFDVNDVVAAIPIDPAAMPQVESDRPVGVNGSGLIINNRG